MVGGWWYFLDANAMQAIWPMFGIANQMLAVMALAIASICIVHAKKSRYVWVTVAPMCFVIITTGSAAVSQLASYFGTIFNKVLLLPRSEPAAVVSAACILAITLCTAIVVISLIPCRWPASA